MSGTADSIRIRPAPPSAPPAAGANPRHGHSPRHPGRPSGPAPGRATRGPHRPAWHVKPLDRRKLPSRGPRASQARRQAGKPWHGPHGHRAPQGPALPPEGTRHAGPRKRRGTAVRGTAAAPGPRTPAAPRRSAVPAPVPGHPPPLARPVRRPRSRPRSRPIRHAHSVAPDPARPFRRVRSGVPAPACPLRRQQGRAGVGVAVQAGWGRGRRPVGRGGRLRCWS